MGAAEGQVRGRADRRNGLPGSPPSCMPRPWKEKPMHANADDLIGEPPMGAAKDRFEVAQIGGMGFRGHLHPACPDHGKKNRCTQTPFSLVSLRWVRRRTGSRSRRSEEWASGVTSILHAPTMERKNRCTQMPMISLASLRWVRRRTGSRSRRSEEWASGVTSILHAPTMERKTDARKCR